MHFVHRKLWITVDNLLVSTQVIHRIHKVIYKVSVDNPFPS